MAVAMRSARASYDVVIVGAGIAGAALAYFLAQRGLGRVLVVEREDHPAYHATGRSAASVVEIDTQPVVQDLKIQGARFLRDPPAGFSEHAILERRGVLVLLDEPGWVAMQMRAADMQRAGMPIELVDRAWANARLDGCLRTEQFAGAAWLPDDGFIDVHELLSAYMGHARRAGVEFRYGIEARPWLHAGACIGIETATTKIAADVVVDAAGAWAGVFARAAGGLPLAITPRRRSIVILDTPAAAALRRWPMVWHDALRVYFRDDAGRLLLCPMDEVPMEPCDATWDEETIAAGIERLLTLAPGLAPRAVLHRWAGLRTFAPDGAPVVGYDPQRRGLFWLAGQGGCGIETSGALGAIAADLILDRHTDRFDPARLSPVRFA